MNNRKFNSYLKKKFSNPLTIYQNLNLAIQLIRRLLKLIEISG